MQKILSFDQSTKISAYSIFIGGKYIEYGVIDLHKMKNVSTIICDGHIVDFVKECD